MNTEDIEPVALIAENCDGDWEHQQGSKFKPLIIPAGNEVNMLY